MEIKHTPGPWLVDEAVRLVVDEDGYLIADCWAELRSDPEVLLADLRLIAASPDLLKAVLGFRQKLVTYCNVYPGDKELQKLLKECDDAMAKATGETP